MFSQTSQEFGRDAALPGAASIVSVLLGVSNCISSCQKTFGELFSGPETVKLLPSILSILVLAGCSVAPPRPASVVRGDYTSMREYVTKLIHHEMDKNSVAGLSIALVDDQQIVWAEGFGYADRERKIPATAQTIYRVGSISKLFTDTAALQLAEQGRIVLDRPLQDYLPEFAIQTRNPDAPAITLRQLMTHHSGLPRNRLKGFANPIPTSFLGVVKDIHDDYAAYPPNLVFSYSNLGITLLGIAIENASHMPYADYMRQFVLAPMQMNNSSFDTGLSASPWMAKGYRGYESAAEPALRDVPAGGLNSSVVDISHFISMIFNGGISGDRSILKAGTVEDMLRTQNSAVPLDYGFHVGLGWMLSPISSTTIHNAGTVAYHNGATALFRSQMYILPEHRLGVVVLANSSTAGQVVDHVATEALSMALEAKSGIRQPEHRKVLPAAGPIPEAMLAEYIGDYTTVAGFVRIYSEGHGLRLNAVGHDFDLVRREDGLFALDYSLLGIHIDLGSIGDIGFSRRALGGRELLVAQFGGREMLVGQRVEAPSNASAWHKRVGDYEITNLDADRKLFEHLRLTEDRGFLLVELTLTDVPQTLHIPLMPVSDSEGLLSGPLSGAGETVRSVVMDGEERLTFSGYILRRK